jgi:hypothetical protein
MLMIPVKYHIHLRAILLALIALIISRVLFIYLMPATYSKDLCAWLTVIEILHHGGNPYQEARVLNYPPFWLQVLFLIGRVSEWLGISVTLLIQSLLVFVEGVIIIFTYLLMLRLNVKSKHIATTLLILAVNPISILLNCQHCNFDVFVGLWILLFTLSLISFYDNKSPVSWLLACFLLGIGIFTKTIPFVLVPILFIGIQGQKKSITLFGLVLMIFPVFIGIGIIYSLAPAGVSANVLGYRSMSGWYGISGILNLIHQIEWIDSYAAFSPFLIILFLIFVTYRVRKLEKLSPDQLIMLILTLLVFLPTFGPGYSPPYILWYLPLMSIYYFLANARMQKILVVGFVILNITYIVEYATFNSHGSFIQFFFPSESMAKICELLGKSKSQSLIRLPMFSFYLVFYYFLLKDKRNVVRY